MEHVRLRNWYFCWNRKEQFSVLQSDGGQTGNRYLLWVRFLVKLFKRASYLRHVNNPLPGKSKYNTQCCDGTTIQNLMWGDSSELTFENNKVSGLDGIHVRNQVNLDDEKLVCLRSRIWIQYLWCRLSLIYILQLELIRTYPQEIEIKE